MGMDQAGLYSRLHNLGVDTRAAEKPRLPTESKCGEQTHYRPVRHGQSGQAPLETGKLSALLEEIFNDAPLKLMETRN